VRDASCPRGRPSIRPRALSLQLVHSPHCTARTSTLVELFASTLPAERLDGSEGARDRWAHGGRREPGDRAANRAQGDRLMSDNRIDPDLDVEVLVLEPPLPAAH
jgi:hypothetical protein